MTTDPTLFDIAPQTAQDGRHYAETPKARADDPDTSHEAAADKRDEVAAQWVAGVLCDGVPRIDEVIARECRLRGCNATDGRLRHGRRMLVLLGSVRDSGERGTTMSGGSAIMWEWVHELTKGE